jgi:hypothetical protein
MRDLHTSDTLLCGGLEHRKIKTRLTDEKFTSVMGDKSQGCLTGPHGDRTFSCPVNSPHKRTCGTVSLSPVLASRAPHARLYGEFTTQPHVRYNILDKIV